MEAYRDPTLPEHERVEDLLGRMTLSEKLAQLGCVWITALVEDGSFDEERALGAIPDGIGQVTRIGASTGLRPQESARLMNQVQRFALERTRLGIPVVVHEESVAGYCARDATVFPQAIGLASTWDPALVQEVAHAISQQMLAVGARHSLAPVLDVARDPRWGRVEETYGEDPVLAGALGCAYVRGLQGEDLRHGVIATGKHFLAHAMPEGGKNHAPVHVGPRELREVYAEPFAAAVRDAGLQSVMNSYSSVDGLPCAGSRAILTDLLRGELGFDGVVVADYFAVSLLISHHHTAAGRGEAAIEALSAGLDMELPATDCFGRPLAEAVEAGALDVGTVDTAVRRVLRAKVRLGLFEAPYVDEGRAAAAFGTPAQRELARRAAAESIVVLSNDGLLPLGPALGTIAVIGPGADDVRLLQGDYHYPAHQESIYEGDAAVTAEGFPSAPDAPASEAPPGLPVPGDHPGERDAGRDGVSSFRPGPYYTPHVTPLAGIAAAVGRSATVVHERGCSVSGADRSGIASALEAARRAEVAVVVVAGRSGLRPSSTVGEARDATDLRLTGLQEELVAAVAGTGTPTVAVVLSGRVHELSSVVAACGALVQAWPLGEQGGAALADILFGRVSPSGRLPVSMPRSVGQVPVHVGVRAGGSKAMFYGDYTDCAASALFPFGHGLSYTSFSYEALEVEASTTTAPVAVAMTLRNSGSAAGAEVVQLYVRDLVASVARPERQLLGFARVDLAPGESRRVSFRVHPSRLAFFDQAMRFVVEPGRFSFALGASASDIRLEAEVDLAGPVVEHRQREVVATSCAVAPAGEG